MEKQFSLSLLVICSVFSLGIADSSEENNGKGLVYIFIIFSNKILYLSQIPHLTFPTDICVLRTLKTEKQVLVMPSLWMSVLSSVNSITCTLYGYLEN